MAELTRQRSHRVAVLSKKPLTTHRYDGWLSEFGIQTTLFAEDTAASRTFLAGAHQYSTSRLFPAWKRNRAVDQAVAAAHAEEPFDRIIALSECDLVRAAELRDHLDIPGQRLASATAFRNKSVMKSLAGGAGLRVPEHRLVDSVSTLMDFADGHPDGVVVKPVDGSGSVGVVVLRDRTEIESWVQARALSCDDPTDYLVEEWVAAPMLSVDGLMRAGQLQAVMVGAYTRTCLHSLVELAPHGILLLDADDPRVAAAREYLSRLLRALPAPEETMSFHCELFDHPRHGPMLCEIACRTGGGNLNLIAGEALGIDLNRASCLGQAGIDVPIERAMPESGRCYGDIVVPRSPRSLPPGLRCDLPGVVRFHRDDRPGRAAKVSDYVIDALLADDDHIGVRRVYDSVIAWLDEHMLSESATVGC
ncbi:acetyl-CoA carboxylase biotin carboxylase subunit family protein [Nocardia sp. NPDC052278]|uniref:ATP-grasp domain-containing protein n=1 Tax=unclassified Nocardia TaxID=2637762 RepID=UPI0036AE3AC1